MAKHKLYEEMYERYKEDYSLSEIGKMYGITRQSVFAGFNCRGYKLRTKKQLPYLTFNGIKFTLRSNGYYGRTDESRTLMHRYVYEFHKGKIPDGWDVHHINGDRTDNRIENLECLPKSEHTKKYSPNCNQFVHRCNGHKH